MGVVKWIGFAIFGTLTSLLIPYIVLDLSKLWSIDLIVNLGYLKIFFLVSLFGFLNLNPKDFDAEEGALEKGVHRLVGKVFCFLLFWGMSYIMFNLLSSC